MELLFLLGRILFAYLLIGSGIGHLTKTADMAAYAEMRKLPNAKLAVQVSGAALVLGGLSILLGIWGDAGSLGVAILLAITAVAMHAFWKETEPMAKMMEMVQFNKDLALVGGALAMYVIFYNTDGFGYYTITGALFN
jgi:putative oxidoreductase